MDRHALVNKEGLVVNVIIWQGAEWLPPTDHYVIQSDSANINDVYNFETNVFVRTSDNQE